MDSPFDTTHEDLKGLFESTKVTPELKTGLLLSGYTEIDYEVLLALQPYWSEIKLCLDDAKPLYGGKVTVRHGGVLTTVGVDWGDGTLESIGACRIFEDISLQVLADNDYILYQPDGVMRKLILEYVPLFTKYYDCEFASNIDKQRFMQECASDANATRLSGVSKHNYGYLHGLKEQYTHIMGLSSGVFALGCDLSYDVMDIKGIKVIVGDNPENFLADISKKLQPVLLVADENKVRILY